MVTSSGTCPTAGPVLRYVLAIGPTAASKRFEVFTESEPVQLADGTPGGRTFSLQEVIDLSRPGETERLRAELAALAIKESQKSAREGLLSPPESHTFDWAAPSAENAMSGPDGQGSAALGIVPPNHRDHPPDAGSRPAAGRTTRGDAAARSSKWSAIWCRRQCRPSTVRPCSTRPVTCSSEAGWGLDELFEAAEDGPARSALFRALGLET